MTDPAQRMQALGRANAVRYARADLKKRLQAGELDFVGLLEDLPDCCAKVPAFDVLQWCPRIGLTRARKLTAGAVSETLPLRCVRGPAREKLLENLRIGGVL